MTAMVELFMPLNPGILLILVGVIAALIPERAGRWLVIAAPVVMLGSEMMPLSAPFLSPSA